MNAFSMRFFIWCVVCLSTLLPGPLNANSLSLQQILDDIGVINFSSRQRLGLGDTVAFPNLDVPRESCMEPAGALARDTSGAVSSGLRLYMIDSYEKFERDLKFSFSLQATIGAQFGKIFGGNASTTANLKFDNFLQNEARSILIVLEASADHGRDYIPNFSLKPEYKKLAENSIQEFIRRCGTHFVRAQRRVSSLRIVYEVSNLNKTTRNFLSAHYSQSASANMGFQAITADAKSTLTADLSMLLNSSSRFGRITYEMQASGGSGVPALARSLRGLNITAASDAKGILDGLADAASEFTRENSTPGDYILVPHPELGAQQIPFDAERFQKLGVIYKALLRIDAAYEEYNKIRLHNPQLYTKYFRVIAEPIEQLRTTLLQGYANCRNRNDCSVRVPERIDAILLDDIVASGEVYAACPLGNVITGRVNSSTASSIEYISEIVVSWSGVLRYLDEIDKFGTEIIRITPDFTVEAIAVDTNRNIRFAEESRGTSRSHFMLFRQATDQSKAVSAGEINLNYLADFRRNVARSLYVIRFRLLNGMQVESVLGVPDMRGCQVARENL